MRMQLVELFDPFQVTGVSNGMAGGADLIIISINKGLAAASTVPPVHSKSESLAGGPGTLGTAGRSQQAPRPRV